MKYYETNHFYPVMSGKLNGRYDKLSATIHNNSDKYGTIRRYLILDKDSVGTRTLLPDLINSVNNFCNQRSMYRRPHIIMICNFATRTYLFMDLYTDLLQNGYTVSVIYSTEYRDASFDYFLQNIKDVIPEEENL